MKEKIHALSEEMVANLGRLVAIDSQLGTPEEGKPRRERSIRTPPGSSETRARSGRGR